MITIRKVEINQRVVREAVEIEVGEQNYHPKFLAHDNKLNAYFYEPSQVKKETWKIRAFLTGDTIGQIIEFLGVVHVWGMTLHIFRVE